MTPRQRALEFARWYNFSDDGREVEDVAEAMIATAEHEAVQGERKRIAAQLLEIFATSPTPLADLLKQIEKGCEP
jgi:hypothetical protein